MDVSPLGFLEFFIVPLFALGWVVLELVARNLDKKRAARHRALPAAGAAPKKDQSTRG